MVERESACMRQLFYADAPFFTYGFKQGAYLLGFLKWHVPAVGVHDPFPHAHLLFLFAEAEAFPALFHDEGSHFQAALGCTVGQELPLDPADGTVDGGNVNNTTGDIIGLHISEQVVPNDGTCLPNAPYA